MYHCFWKKSGNQIKTGESGIPDFGLIRHEVLLSNKTAVFFTVFIMTVIEQIKSKIRYFVRQHPIQI
jgi:hypothetical protein